MWVDLRHRGQHRREQSDTAPPYPPRGDAGGILRLGGTGGWSSSLWVTPDKSRGQQTAAISSCWGQPARRCQVRVVFLMQCRFPGMPELEKCCTAGAGCQRAAGSCSSSRTALQGCLSWHRTESSDVSQQIELYPSPWPSPFPSGPSL